MYQHRIFNKYLNIIVNKKYLINNIIHLIHNNYNQKLKIFLNRIKDFFSRKYKVHPILIINYINKTH